MLDEAGYKDKDGDGFREDPKGKKFVVNFSHYQTTNPTFEARAKQIAQYWEEVGLKTKVTMTEANLYYDMLEKGDKSVEVFFGGWSTGSDPDPSGLWRSDALWNYPRWVNADSDKLLDDALDVSIVGTIKRKTQTAVCKLAKLFNEEVPAIPISELDDTFALTKRVKGVEVTPLGTNSPHEWWIEQ